MRVGGGRRGGVGCARADATGGADLGGLGGLGLEEGKCVGVHVRIGRWRGRIVVLRRLGMVTTRTAMRVELGRETVGKTSSWKAGERGVTGCDGNTPVTGGGVKASDLRVGGHN